MKYKYILLLMNLLLTSATFSFANVISYDGYYLKGNTIFSSDGKEIINLPKLYHEHYHPFEIHHQDLFWIVRTADYNVDKNWQDQLWVMNLASKKSAMLLSARGINFRVSPDGMKIAWTGGNNQDLKVLDRSNKKIKVICKSNMADEDSSFSLLTWSSDNSKFWFGKGEVGGWRQLGLFSHNEVTWFNYKNDTHESAFNPDYGWLVKSNVPQMYDADAQAKYEQSKQIATLSIIDVYTGRIIPIAKAMTTIFEPHWNHNGNLEYTIKGKKYLLTVKQIKSKFVSG